MVMVDRVVVGMQVSMVITLVVTSSCGIGYGAGCEGWGAGLPAPGALDTTGAETDSAGGAAAPVGTLPAAGQSVTVGAQEVMV